MDYASPVIRSWSELDLLARARLWDIL